MHLDFDIRYKEIIKLLEIEKEDSTVLEVGALPPACLSAYYLGKNCNYCGINKNYSSTKYKIEKTDFLENSFDTNSFSYSISTDTLEHIEKPDRQKFVDEMIRVTKERVIIGVPNPKAQVYEETLVKLLEASKQGKHYIKFFKEHEEFGIPSREEMLSYFSKYNYRTLQNFNLQYWIGILLSDVFDFEINLEKIPDINNEPAYRTFYIIDK